MTYDECEGLLTRMGQCWRVPFGAEWSTVFETMDAGRAGTAFIRLRDTEERPPSIAKFKGAYAALRGETSHEPRCVHCDGTGMVAPDVITWGAESDPCEFCEMGKLQADRVSAPRPEGPGKLSDRERTVGLANVDQCRAILDGHLERSRRRSGRA